VPIDFAAIADQFREPLTKQTHPLGPVFEKLEEAVKKLAEQSVRAERATRAYPIFRYRDGALAVHVDPLGAAPLPSAAPPLAFVDGLKTGGQQFLAGIGWTRTAVRQELALPRLLLVTSELVKIALDSIDRFRPPTSAMFDPRELRLSDLVGLLVLGYNSLLHSRTQLLLFALGSVDFYHEYQRLFPPATENAAPAPAVGTVDTLVDLADSTAAQLLDAVVLLPVLGETLAVLVHDGSLEAKRLILVELSEVEGKVRGVRAAALEGLVEGADLGRLAAEWLLAARIVILTDLAILTTVGPSLLNSFLHGVRAFAEGVTEWGKWLADLMEKIRSIVDAIMNFDLLGFAIRLVIPPWILDLLPDLPKITVDDLISFLLGLGAAWVKTTLNAFFDAALRILNTIDQVYDVEDLYWKVDALAELCNIVLTPTPFTLPPDVMPTTPLAGFPDIYEAFFGGGRAATFVSTVDRFGVETRVGIRTALGGATTFLAELGSAFAVEADRAARLGSVGRMRELAAGSADPAERVFGPEAESARARAERPRTDELAIAFDQAVTSGGFALVGSAIPAYVGELRRFWAAKRPPVERPTSPHVLARHGRLGGVRVPRMTVRASGRSPDRRLATLVAGRFHDAVGEAYVSGRREFELAGGAPLRKPARRPSRRPVPERGGAGRGR
jgi:hypothetical protein